MILKNSRAISMVEIMVTTVIITLIIGSLHSLLSSGRMSWGSYENKLAVQRDARQALSRLSRDLREASGVSVTQDSGNATISFTKSDLGSVSYAWTNSGSDAKKLLRTFQSVSTTIATNISAISYTATASSVLVNVTASKTDTSGKTATFQLVEKIALR